MKRSDIPVIARAVRGFVDKKIAALPVMAGPKGDKGDRGDAGNDVDPTVVDGLKAEIAALHVSVAELKSLAADLAKQIAAMPAGANGKDGTSVTVDEVRPMIAAEVERAVKAIPQAPAGRDGVSIASAVIDRKGCLVVTLSDGTTHDLGVVVGKDGDPGIAGKDGLGFDDLSAELLDDERTIVVKAQRGDQSKTIGTFTLPVVLDRGVFVDGHAYAKGDGVTWGGSFWIARADTTAKPGLNTDDSRAWRLAIKKGQDGKEGRPGKDGERGPQGPKGDRGYGG